VALLACIKVEEAGMKMTVMKPGQYARGPEREAMNSEFLAPNT
jgi:hypothetical protein